MLSIQVRTDNRSYSSPTAYWLTHLCAQEAETPELAGRTNPHVKRRTQMRRLRYKQTHSWSARIWHSLMALFGHRHRSLLASC